MSLCLKSFGAIIIIQDQPTPLEYRNEMYYLPIGFVIDPLSTNLYVTMDGIPKICFFNKASSELFEQAAQISIIINGIKTDWNCFPYKTTVYPVLPW
jgi:hypothetical protein